MSCHQSGSFNAQSFPPLKLIATCSALRRPERKNIRYFVYLPLESKTLPFLIQNVLNHLDCRLHSRGQRIIGFHETVYSLGRSNIHLSVYGKRWQIIRGEQRGKIQVFVGNGAYAKQPSSQSGGGGWHPCATASSIRSTSRRRSPWQNNVKLLRERIFGSFSRIK